MDAYQRLLVTKRKKRILKERAGARGLEIYPMTGQLYYSIIRKQKGILTRRLKEHHMSVAGRAVRKVETHKVINLDLMRFGLLLT